MLLDLGSKQSQSVLSALGPAQQHHIAWLELLHVLLRYF